MFRNKGTIIAEGLKIKGSVSAEGLVEVNGQIEGDVHCTSLFVSPKAVISGGVEKDPFRATRSYSSLTPMSWGT